MKTIWIRLRVWQLNRQADCLLKIHQRNQRAARKKSEQAHRHWLASSTLRGQAERLQRDAA